MLDRFLKRLWRGFPLGFGMWVKIATCRDYGGYFSWRLRKYRYRNSRSYQLWRVELIMPAEDVLDEWARQRSK